MYQRFLWFFTATAAPALVSLIMVPLTTSKLAAADFGVFALLMSIVGFGSAFAGLGATYIIAKQYLGLEDPARQRLVSTIINLGVLIWIVFALVVIAVSSVNGNGVFGLKDLRPSFLYISLAAGLCGIPWTVAADVLTVSKQSKSFAAISISQSIGGAIAITTCLYFFDAGPLALYIGALVGAFAGCIGSLVRLRSCLSLTIDRKTANTLLKFVPTTLGANLLDSAQTVLERQLLALFVGVSGLGIYTHAQSYRRLAFTAMKSVSRAVWPETLEEANASELSFEQTRYVWWIVYTLLFLCGLVCALFGEVIISWWTHGKFSDAYVFTALWMVFLLIQFTGRSQTGFMFAKGFGLAYSRMALAANSVGVLLLVLLVPHQRLTGAFLAALVPMLLLRIGMHVFCWRRASIPFDDGPAILGVVIICGALLAETAKPSALVRAIILCLAVGFYCAGTFGQLRASLSFGQQKLSFWMKPQRSPDGKIN